MAECPRCGSEMREGEAFVRITTPAEQVSSSYGMLGMPGVGMPSGEMSEEKVQWREGEDRTEERLANKKG